MHEGVSPLKRKWKGRVMKVMRCCEQIHRNSPFIVWISANFFEFLRGNNGVILTQHSWSYRERELFSKETVEGFQHMQGNFGGKEHGVGQNQHLLCCLWKLDHVTQSIRKWSRYLGSKMETYPVRAFTCPDIYSHNEWRVGMYLFTTSFNCRDSNFPFLFKGLTPTRVLS